MIFTKELNMKITVVIVVGLFFLISGILLLTKSEKIRENALKNSKVPFLGCDNPYLKWIKTPSYMSSMKSAGILSIIAFIIVLITVIFF